MPAPRRTPLVIAVGSLHYVSHAIPRRHIPQRRKNREIPTPSIQILKYPQVNCMRNCVFTVDRPRSSHRLYGRHPRPRTRAPDNECHRNETRIRHHRHDRRVGDTSAMLMPPTRYVEADSREAQASLGATSSSASPRWICPLATGVTPPNFFLFVTTTGVMVS